jgi:acetolactate synthase-1/2/3 large subunit
VTACLLPARDTLADPSLAHALVGALRSLGVREAYGVSGGAMAVLWDALSAGALAVRHCRHESGAAFAATEAWFASGRPALLFTTTGPGLANALTGVLAARSEGAQLIVVSAASSAAARGRYAIQETSAQTMPAELFRAGPVFDVAIELDAPDGLAAALTVLARGLASGRGFVAHLSIPTAVQAMRIQPFDVAKPEPAVPREPAADVLQACVDALAAAPFAIWVGHGARAASAEVRTLAERSGAAVFCTPRAKGIFPETHPQFIGVTGMGGHDAVGAWLGEHRPERILVLGSRLGEASSLWDARFIPRAGFVHVDLDPDVFGVAFPDAATLAVHADAGALLRALLARLPASRGERPAWRAAQTALMRDADARTDRVRPEALMDAVQRCIVDTGDAIVLAESGNAFIWATHCLRFATPGRYRVSTGFGAMGHAVCGVVGAALASGRSAVALVGDGAMLMHNEINTAVKYGARAVWIVLNDGRYGMCHQGMQALGLSADASFPAVDFAAFAAAQGAHGLRVSCESALDPALRQALDARGPIVVDVLVDTDARAPSAPRNRGLARQLAGADEVAFPPR